MSISPFMPISLSLWASCMLDTANQRVYRLRLHAHRNARVSVTKLTQLGFQLGDLLPDADVVVVTLPGGAATRHVVEVKAENRKTLYVDPSGSAYGRYVGIAVEA